MRVTDILKRFSHFKVEGEVDTSVEFIERVYYREDSEELEKILTDIFGPAVKSAGEKTTDDFHKLTINYGGLQDDQILYYKKFDGISIIAMIWPWKDNNQFTLKLASFKE